MYSFDYFLSAATCRLSSVHYNRRPNLQLVIELSCEVIWQIDAAVGTARFIYFSAKFAPPGSVMQSLAIPVKWHPIIHKCMVSLHRDCPQITVPLFAIEPVDANGRFPVLRQLARHHVGL